MPNSPGLLVLLSATFGTVQASQWVLRGIGACDAGILQGGISVLSDCQAACESGAFACLSVFWVPADLECYLASSLESCTVAGAQGHIWDFVSLEAPPDDDEAGISAKTIFVIVAICLGLLVVALGCVAYFKRKTICPGHGIKKMTAGEIAAAAEDPLFKALADAHLERYYSVMNKNNWTLNRIVDVKSHLELEEDGFKPEVAKRIYTKALLPLQQEIEMEIYTVKTEILTEQEASTRPSLASDIRRLERLDSREYALSVGSAQRLVIPANGRSLGGLRPQRQSSGGDLSGRLLEGFSQKRCLSPGDARRSRGSRLSRGESRSRSRTLQPDSRRSGNNRKFGQPRSVRSEEGQPSVKRRKAKSNEGQISHYAIATPQPRGTSFNAVVESTTEEELFSNNGDTMQLETAQSPGEGSAAGSAAPRREKEH